MKKKLVAILGFMTVTALGVGVVCNLGNGNLEKPNADSTLYTLTLDGTNSPTVSGLTANTTIGNVTINYALAQVTGSEHVTIGVGGSLYNYASTGYKGRVTSIESIKVDYTSSAQMTLEYSLSKDGSIMSEPVSIADDAVTSLSTRPYYFVLRPSTAAAVINGIEIKYYCAEDTSYQMDEMPTTFTAKDSNEIIWKATRSGTSAVIETLNKEVNESYSGTLSINNDELVCTMTGALAAVNAQLKWTIQSNLAKFAFKSATADVPAYESALPHLDLYPVYQVEDYESFTATGVGKDQSHAWSEISGLRAAYHSDYYSGASSVSDKTSLFGDKGWSFMGSSDYITYTANKGHNNSKAAIFKLNANKCRYVSMNSMINVPKAIGRGSYLSFWAKGGYTSDLSTLSSNSTNLKVRVFFANPITKCDDTTGTAQVVTIPAKSDWARYTIALDSSKTYYGFSFFSDSATSYVPIDDIEIYTHNPYAVYEPPVTPSYKKTLTVRDNITVTGVGNIPVYIALGDNNSPTVFVNGTDANPSNYTVDADSNLSMDLSYTVSSLTATKLEAVVNDHSLTSVKISGTLATYIENNGSITLNEITYDQNLNEENLTSSDQLKAAMNRWYMSGSWQKDTTNADRLALDTSVHCNGDKSIKLRCYSAAFSVTLTNDFSSAQSKTGLGYWVRNNTGKSLKTKFFIYKGTGLTNSSQPGSEVTVPGDGTWTYVQCGFTADIYNIRLYFELSGGAGTDFINIDYIHLY